MRREDLQFSYPETLIATVPKVDFRIAALDAADQPEEISKDELLAWFAPGDVLVINDSKVELRRVFAADLEILFLKPVNETDWEVLFPARDYKVTDQIALPGGLTGTLKAKGLPQVLSLSEPIGEKYFAEFGEPALPPYIQKARDQRHALKDDRNWYQTDWAENPGSAAAPTASLHFSKADLQFLRDGGVNVMPVTLHVGLGTFLPVKTADLNDHQMHAEDVMVPAVTIAAIEAAKTSGKRVWALGTTALRAIEAAANGDFKQSADGGLFGETRLFIQPGYEFKSVDGLLTNFHQPESTLLALVMAFAGREQVLRLYDWAIDKKFRLFSYGDLTVWTR